MKTYRKPQNSMFLFGRRAITLMIVLVLALGGVCQVCGTLIVRDFEGIPETYLYWGGGQNLGSYYPDLFFGPDVTVMDRVRYGYNDTEYPPHSGDAIIWADYSFDQIRVDFVDLPSNYVEAWYTSTETVYMEAYDAYDNLVDNASSIL